jgi:hypothetical protein
MQARPWRVSLPAKAKKRGSKLISSHRITPSTAETKRHRHTNTEWPWPPTRGCMIVRFVPVSLVLDCGEAGLDNGTVVGAELMYGPESLTRGLWRFWRRKKKVCSRVMRGGDLNRLKMARSAWPSMGFAGSASLGTSLGTQLPRPFSAPLIVVSSSNPWACLGEPLNPGSPSSLHARSLGFITKCYLLALIRSF